MARNRDIFGGLLMLFIISFGLIFLNYDVRLGFRSTPLIHSTVWRANNIIHNFFATNSSSGTSLGSIGSLVSHTGIQSLPPGVQLTGNIGNTLLPSRRTSGKLPHLYLPSRGEKLNLTKDGFIQSDVKHSSQLQTTSQTQNTQSATHTDVQGNQDTKNTSQNNIPLPGMTTKSDKTNGLETGSLMTLFTTFKNTSDRINVQLNTVRNWAQFLPNIQPVLFSTFQTGNMLVQNIFDGPDVIFFTKILQIPMKHYGGTKISYIYY